jgi:hypothetical protein
MTSIEIAVSIGIASFGIGVFASILYEYIALAARLRSRHLEHELVALFGGREAFEQVLSHPLLIGLRDPKGGLRSYVDPDLLAQALIGTFVVDFGEATNPEEGKARGLGAIGLSTVREPLRLAYIFAGGRPNQFRAYVAEWLDKAMTSGGEPYKARAQLGILSIAFLTSFALDMDVISIATNIETRAKISSELSLLDSSHISGNTEVTPPGNGGAGCAEALRLMRSMSSECLALSEAKFGSRTTDEKARLDGLQLVHRTIGSFLAALLASLCAVAFFDVAKQFVGIRYGLRRPEHTSRNHSSGPE